MPSYEGFDVAWLEQYQRKRGAAAVKVVSGPPLPSSGTNPTESSDQPAQPITPSTYSDQSQPRINPESVNESQKRTNPSESSAESRDEINPWLTNETSKPPINPVENNDASAQLNNPMSFNENHDDPTNPLSLSDLSEDETNPKLQNEPRSKKATNPPGTNEKTVNVNNPSATSDTTKRVTNPAKYNVKTKSQIIPLNQNDPATLEAKAVSVKLQSNEKRNKNNAIPTTIDGIRFASKWEAEVYLQQKARVQSGEIAMLLLQVPIVLPGTTETGKQRNRMNIDFLAIKDLDAVEFIDAKGKTERDWHLRKCMAENEYGIEIQVVKRPTGKKR